MLWHIAPVQPVIFTPAAALTFIERNAITMTENLLDRQSAEQLISRVEKLQPTRKAVWGSMTATEMLLHCNKVHELLLLPASLSPKKTTLKQYLIRYLVLYIMPNYPKNAKAPQQIATKGSITSEAFEQQKENYIALLRRFQQPTEIKHHHPYFGNLSTTQWGLASWKHADHHLRQFGV